MNSLPVLVSLTRLKWNRVIADTAFWKPLRASGNGGCSYLTASTEPTGKSCRVEGGYGPHCSSMTIRFYFELAVEFAQSLAHSGKTNARFSACIPKPGQPLGGYAASVISYL